METQWVDCADWMRMAPKCSYIGSETAWEGIWVWPYWIGPRLCWITCITRRNFRFQKPMLGPVISLPLSPCFCVLSSSWHDYNELNLFLWYASPQLDVFFWKIALVMVMVSLHCNRTVTKTVGNGDAMLFIITKQIDAKLHIFSDYSIFSP